VRRTRQECPPLAATSPCPDSRAPRSFALCEWMSGLELQNQFCLGGCDLVWELGLLRMLNRLSVHIRPQPIGSAAPPRNPPKAA
jgi:hypothetical protein